MTTPGAPEPAVADIVIVGAGVVGTATGRGFLARGHRVRFVDVNPERCAVLRDEGLDASVGLDLPGASTFVFLTVPTPDVGRGYDLRYVESAARTVGRSLALSSGFNTVVVRSTVPPGTTDELVRRILEDESGLVAGTGFGLASNPEFLRAATAAEDFLYPWMTVIGSRSRRTAERLAELLRPFGGELRIFRDPAAAELVKCAHNIFNATKVSFWNEFWMISRRMGLPADEIAATVARSAEASINPDYGIHGGAPFDGACLPKDTRGFLGFADGMGVPMPLLEAVVSVNDFMRERMAEELTWSELVGHSRGPTGTVPPVESLRAKSRSGLSDVPEA